MFNVFKFLLAASHFSKGADHYNYTTEDDFSTVVLGFNYFARVYDRLKTGDIIYLRHDHGTPQAKNVIVMVQSSIGGVVTLLPYAIIPLMYFYQNGNVKQYQDGSNVQFNR